MSSKQKPAYHLAYYRKNRERKAQLNKAWYERNKERVAEINRRYNQRPEVIVKSRLRTYKWQAARRGLEWALSMDQFIQLRTGPCWYCGATGLNGLDRVNNLQGYTAENTVSCCATHNRMKSDLTLEDFVAACRRVAKHLGD